MAKTRLPKLTTSEIIYTYFMPANGLRNKGYDLKKMLDSAKESLQDKQKIRARMQFRTMSRFQPMGTEPALFEESGNILFSHNYKKQAVNHWDIAYNHGHKPYTMCMDLGHQALVNGQLNKSQDIFYDLAFKYPFDSIVFNEYGVVHFVSAIQNRHDTEKFGFYCYLATASFEASIANQPNSIAEQNKRIVASLTYTPHYGSPHSYLKTSSNSSTRMIDALIKGLTINKAESKNSTDTSLNPTTQTSKVPVTANELALDELPKTKHDQACEESHTPRALTPK